MAVFEDPTGAVLAAWEPLGTLRCRPDQRPQLPNLKRAPEPRPGDGHRFYAGGLFEGETDD